MKITTKGMRVAQQGGKMPDFLFKSKPTGIKYKKFKNYDDMMLWCKGFRSMIDPSRGILVGRNQFRKDYAEQINVTEYEIEWEEDSLAELTKYKVVYIARFGLEYSLFGKKYKKVIECQSVESKEDAIDRLYYGLAKIPEDNLILIMHHQAGEELPRWDSVTNEASSVEPDMADYPFDLVIADGEPNMEWFGGSWIELGKGDFLFLRMPLFGTREDLFNTPESDWGDLNDLIARSQR